MGMCSPLASNKHMSQVHSSEVCKSDNSDVAEIHAMVVTERGCCVLNNHVASKGGIAVRLLISRLFASHKNQFYAMQERRDPLISLLGLHYSSIYNTNDVLPNSSLIQPVSYTLVSSTSGQSWWQALRGNGLNTREYSLTKRGHC